MSLKTTALHALHSELGGKLVDFAGWELPVQFAGGLAEHQHTREAASLFDVSHMGQVVVRPVSGDLADAAAASRNPHPGLGGRAGRRADNAMGCSPATPGGILDDLMFAHHGDRFFVVVNAARADHDIALLSTLDQVTVEHLTDRALLALQGPRAEVALARLIPEVAALTFMDSVILDWAGVEVWVSRSGYTGEDGFEISVPNEHADRLARQLLTMDEVAPAGLGARDSLRLEAGMPLYGHDLTPEVTPAEAGLGFAIPRVRRLGGSREGGFPGADVILAQLADGVARERVGLRPEGRAPVREGAPIFRH